MDQRLEAFLNQLKAVGLPDPRQDKQVAELLLALGILGIYGENANVQITSKTPPQTSANHSEFEQTDYSPENSKQSNEEVNSTYDGLTEEKAKKILEDKYAPLNQQNRASNYLIDLYNNN